MSTVWYAAYGSNLRRARLLAYLEGSAPAPGQVPHGGARDPTPPAADAWSTVPYALRFAGASRRWGGGLAFLDPVRGSGRAHVRLWLVGLDQFADVMAQECGGTAGDVDLRPDAVGPDAVVLPDARYGRVLRPGDHDGRPVLTCTWVEPPEPAPPSASYRAAVLAGFAEGPLDPAEAAAYLHAAADVAGGAEARRQDEAAR